MADYSNYNEKQYNNQNAYLNNLINSGSAGQAAWAKNEQAKLNSQYSGNKSSGSSSSTSSSGKSSSSSSSSNKVSSSSSGSSNKSSGSSGNSRTDYSGYNEQQYNNQKTYLENLRDSGSAGNKSWAQQELESLNAQYQGNNAVTSNPVANNTNKPTTVTPQTQPAQPQWNTSGSNWTNLNGANGLNYAISSDNGTIIVTNTDGTQTRYLPTDEKFNAMYAELQKQTGNSYTPTYNWTTANGNDVTTKNYLLGNPDLRYALEQYMAANNSNTYDIEGYAKDLYNRVGTQRADGSMVTLDDVDAELNRLGLSDYNSQNVYYTAGGNLIPKNEFATTKEGSFGSNSPDSTWVSYGGQDYLLDGDSANFIDYVNGKTGNTTNLDYIFDDMANNPYANKDAEFAQMYQDALNQFNSSANIQTPTTGTGGSYTGYANVDRFIDYANSLEGYDQATGGTGSSNIWNEIQAMLQGGLESQQAFLDNQRTQAEQNAENLMRQAYVIGKLQGDSVKEAMSAAGLGTSGAMQSAQLGVQNNYNSNVADIRSNLQQMISNFDEQELQALIDHTNSLTKYKYQIDNDEHDRAMQNAQLYMQQMEMLQAQQQQDWENAYRQQLMELENQQYADSQAQSQSDTDYERKQNEAAYYAQLVNAGAITAQQYQQFLAQLGLI